MPVVGEVAEAVSTITKTNKKQLYDDLVKLAKKATREADVKLDSRGQPIEDPIGDLGENVLIVDPGDPTHAINRPNREDEQEDA